MAADFDRLYWRRIGFVEIADSSGNMVRYGGEDQALDIRFDVKKLGNLYNEFSVSVLGLSKENISELITWQNPQTFANPRKIKVYAGYYDENKKNKGAELIAEGGVWNAFPTNPPNMWLNMKASRFCGQHVPVEGMETMYNSTLGEIAQKIAKIVGVSYNKGSSWKAKNVKEDKKVMFKFEGLRKDELFAEFAKKNNLSLHEVDGVIYVDDRHGEKNDPSGAEPLNAQRGLLGVANVDYAGATATMRLNDSADLHSWVKLESILVPKASGEYYVIEKHHVGHLRGREWKTDLTLLRHVGRKG